MSGHLKTSANKAFHQKDEIDVILDMPITKLRLELKDAFQEKKFTAEQYEDFVQRLSQIGDLDGQAAIAREAAQERSVENTLDIELNNDSKQLLWAATITHMMSTGKESIVFSPLWKQIEGSIGVHNEAITVANVIVQSLQNEDVTFDWGHPGSWFYRDPKKNHMNFDLYFMLLLGFDHTRAVELHEMGHSDLSVGYPPSMQALYDKVFNVVDNRTIARDNNEEEDDEKTQKRSKSKVKMTKKEQVELALLAREWQMRHRSWNVMEDITVDQYAINWSRRLPQDFGYSMNHAATDLRGYGEIVMGKDIERPVHMLSDKAPEKAAEIDRKYDEYVKRLTMPLSDDEVKDVKAGNISVPVAQKLYEEIQRATLLAGYVKNGLFSDTPENWERFRVFMQDISRVVDISKLPDAKGRDAFQYLFDVCAEGADSIRLLQPTASDHFIIHEPYTNQKDSYRAVVKETNQKRNQIMETIWDVYLKPFADVLLKDYEQKVEEKLDQQQQQQQQQQGQGQSGEGQDQDGDGDPSDDGQSQSSQGKGKSSPGQPGGQSGGAGGDGDGDGEPMDLDEEIENDIGDMAETPEEEHGKNADQDSDANGKAKGQDKQSEEKDSDRGGPGWDAPPKDHKNKPKRAGDLKNQSKIDDKPMSAEQKQAMKDRANDMSKPDSGKLSTQGGSQDGVDLSVLAKGNWTDFNRRMIELAPVVNRLAETYKRIRDEQKRQIVKESKNLNFMAEDGDVMSRLDRDKVLQTKFKQASGQKITIDDFKKFREDSVHDMYSTIEMVYMIDGSGSMPSVILDNGVTAMESALQSAAIGYMACRKAGIDSYIIMWGDAHPRVVATPKSEFRDVGAKLEALRKGINSGTDLAPAIVETVKSMSTHRNNNGTISGSSHMLIFSDGDIFDGPKAARALEIVSKNAHNISIDVAVLKKGSGSTAMEEVFQGVINRTGSKLVGIINGSDPRQIPLDMARLTWKRVKNFKVKTEPDSMKRQKLRQLHGKLKK